MAMNVSTFLVSLFSLLFGLSSWIAINGLWVETPILVTRLPEGWKLASYITIITQLANVALLLYSGLRHFLRRNDRLEVISIHVIFTIGTVSLILLIFLWDHILVVFHSQHSVAFLVLTFFLAIVDCTSSVLYLPFMARVPARFVFSHLIGQALSGLVPSFLALIQGVGGNPECILSANSTHKVPQYRSPRFSIEVFLLLLILLVLLSWLGFVCLSNLNRLLRYRRGEYETEVGVVCEINARRPSSSSPLSINDTHDESGSSLSRVQIVTYLLTMSCMASLINGILPAIQPYSVLYLGNTTYHLVVTLASIASPCGCLLASIKRVRRVRSTLVLALALGACTASYILTAAVNCPKPIVAKSIAGLVIVLVWIVNNMSFSYAKASIVDVFRSHNESNRYLFIDGLCSQAGSTLGAFTIFYFVNYTNTFKAFDPCQLA